MNRVSFVKMFIFPILIGYFDAIPIKFFADFLIEHDKLILDLYVYAKIKKNQDSFEEEKQMARFVKR